MRIIFISLIFFLIITTAAEAQDNPVRVDTTTMPRLEIPEITIVGKKAITLPFARKGEIYDIDIYEVSPPDTSLIESRPEMSFPVGSLPRYEEPLIPWHVSAEGSFGSFSTGHMRAFADYKGKKWGIYGNGGFRTTNGHTAHASGNSFYMDANAHSLVSTDNEILKSFRVSGGLQLMHDTYGIFGIQNSLIDRSRTNLVLDSRLGSLEREESALDFNLRANIWSLSDQQPALSSSISAVSPELTASYSTKVSNVQLQTQISYLSTSLNYDHPAQTPSLFGISAAANWWLRDNWNMLIGGEYQGGAGSDGSSHSLIIPFAVLKWEFEQDRAMSLWFKPEMHLASYGDYTQKNPYLIREIVLHPERKWFNVGGTFWFNSGLFSLEINGAFAKSTDKCLTLADSGRLYLAFIDADQFIVRGTGTLNVLDNTRFTFTGVIQPSFEDGKSRQLPMIPLVQLAARAELTLNLPLAVWSSLEFWSRQNVEMTGSKTLDELLQLNAGAASNIIPRTVLSLEVDNFLNHKYEWWSGYIAPGRTIKFEAKINFQ
jgi:hypothetical protein